MEELSSANKNKDEAFLPGFRFHPTDEELVGFYLRRKVERKTLRIELIREIDIYKFDPWDLPKISSFGDKEWYFFCIRVRKYRNSVRPNRVTRSGFWKATGIDKPIYCSGETHECIGLKKSLVYYKGSAGKGTKTDWMMQEFRLPPSWKNAKQSINYGSIPHEAEIWTLCRIFQRKTSQERYKPNRKHHSNTETFVDTSSKSYGLESADKHQFMNSQDGSIQQMMNASTVMHMNQEDYFSAGVQISTAQPSYALNSIDAEFWDLNCDEFFKDGKCDELRLVVDTSNPNG